ncbi:uncharacterized protein STEHIDRAFT_162898 [Stereum hirsutum FP-91666 SS1]|uniref:Uncharacterized protein n=1 Tax=Stereum hirsutum (strain FP-91666) TaxID=721885 RepID=R7S045_STEHR|nr:uncharacterized protein STEHIDRAFT_162898 [Stereum hirsutum FP-91666 SS1]EIM80483.1 hypothetical protein STEHIDRAFT_162898 [Stereum hirsutum FP-91666 SS1]
MAAALLTDGYVARTFGTNTARQHFRDYLKRDIESLDVYYDGQGRCYFLKANSLGYPHPTIRLDHYAEAPHLIVTQFYWLPRTTTDFDRYVWAPQLGNTIFFGLPGKGRGLSVTDAAAGNCLDIPGREAYFSPVAKASTQIRVLWPGYPELQRQVQTRDETPAKNPIRLEKFIQHIGRTVDSFLAHTVVLNGRGYRITKNDILILGAVQVSSGSWQALLQYKP